jgi:hypothetical protein
MDLKIDDYQLNKTNIYGDPCKAIKNENQIIANVGLKDSEMIYLKNIAEEINEDYFISLYKGNDFEFEDLKEFYDNNNVNENNVNELCLAFNNDDIEKIKNPKSFVFYEIPEKNFLLNFYVRKFLICLFFYLFICLFI